MSSLERDPLFVALTRPQMFAGVTYSYFVANAVLATELFLVLRTIWAVVAAVVIHVVGVLACLREPRFFDLWLVKVGRCPRVKNYAIWQCNSYRP
ncbi:type IV secretion system protein VirB3 [Sphingomonas sp. DT-204]|uniref:type IV secretion system protein VirB3 n=1 Tax=Sphingomonas sp. DT-204 TaxID=3396166 RepID=UPI003F1D94A4